MLDTTLSHNLSRVHLTLTIYEVGIIKTFLDEETEARLKISKYTTHDEGSLPRQVSADKTMTKSLPAEVTHLPRLIRT